MNEKVDLTKILKDCPKGTKLYSTVFGEVEFDKIDDISLNRPIVVSNIGGFERFAKDGRLFYRCDGECVLFPSAEQRNWDKFEAPWYKKEPEPKFKVGDWLCANELNDYAKGHIGLLTMFTSPELEDSIFHVHMKEEGIYAEHYNGILDSSMLPDEGYFFNNDQIKSC